MTNSSLEGANHLDPLYGMGDLKIHGWIMGWVQYGIEQWYESPYAYLFTSHKFIRGSANDDQDRA